jgi:hypothetical protein
MWRIFNGDKAMLLQQGKKQILGGAVKRTADTT